MGKRHKIGIIYQYNENWIGGTYYIQNLIKALCFLNDNDKFDIVIICKTVDEFRELKQTVKYDYLEHRFHERRLHFWERGVNFMSRKILKKNVIINHKLNCYKDIDVLFPAWSNVGAFAKCKSLINWIPDFQEHYFPEFFTSREIRNRREGQLAIVANSKYVLLSSRTALDDFDKFYPEYKKTKFVLPFAVSHDEVDRDTYKSIAEKYNLPKSYFICSNQFWKHKNHAIVLKAISHLKEAGSNLHFVFTGKEEDWRNPDYFNELIMLVEKLGIANNVSFLGFISRKDQLALLKSSLAVIQPSLFEGWSSIIEDAKAFSKKIIASNIKVHLEQLLEYDNKEVFNPHDYLQLTECINKSVVPVIIDYNYHEKVKEYAQAFLNIVNQAANAKSS